MSLFLKKDTISSKSFSLAPPEETITGLRIDAIFSINGQSFMSELAIFIIGISNSTQRSTDSSSKGVAIGIQPIALTLLTNI